MPGLCKVSYFNNSNEAIPPFSCLQADGNMQMTGTGDFVMKVVKPGNGKGPYFIDDGKGADPTGEGQYGDCYRAFEGCVWASFNGATEPTPWSSVGPTNGAWELGASGSNFFYAGQWDQPNTRILVTAKSAASLIPHVVTQTGPGGVNTDIVPSSSYGASSFRARPVDPASVPLVSTLSGPGEVDVIPLILTGPTFTNAVVLVLTGPQNYALGGYGLRFRGNVVGSLAINGVGPVLLHVFAPVGQISGLTPDNIDVT